MKLKITVEKGSQTELQAHVSINGIFMNIDRMSIFTSKIIHKQLIDFFKATETSKLILDELAFDEEQMEIVFDRNVGNVSFKVTNH